MACNEIGEGQLNEGLVRIGSKAFQGCGSLFSSMRGCIMFAIKHSKNAYPFTIPSSILVISELLFSNCSQLVTLQLNEGLETVMRYALKTAHH